MAYGIGGFGDGFVSGYSAMERITAAREETNRQNEENKRRQITHDRVEGEKKQLAELGAEVSRLTSEWLGGQSGQPAQAQQGVGPPAPDGTPAPAPMGINTGQPAAAAKPMGYMDALKDSQQHLQRIAPLLTKIYMLADPKKGAEYAAGLADTKTQYAIAEEAAVGRLLLSNPNSGEARDALVEFYKKVPDGRDIIPETYEVLGNGSIKFRTRDNNGQEAPEIIEPARIRAMMMRNLSADKVATVLLGEDRNKEQKRYHDAQIDNMERDDKRREKEYGIRVQEARDARQERNDLKRERQQDRADLAASRERDERLRGIDSVLIGDPKTFADRPPEERQAAMGMRGSALDLLDANPERFKGKGGAIGGRALDIANSVMAGKAKLMQDDADPQNVIAEIGGAQYKLPASSYVVQQLLQSRKQKQTEAAPKQPRGVPIISTF